MRPRARKWRDATVVRALAEQALGDREVVVRINAIGTPWCENDVRAFARSGTSAILFPKIESESNVKIADAMLAFYGAPRQTG